MAQQTIGIGSSYDDLSADKERDAFDKVNDNFNEIYDIGICFMLTFLFQTGIWMQHASKDVNWTLPADHVNCKNVSSCYSEMQVQVSILSISAGGGQYIL